MPRGRALLGAGLILVAAAMWGGGAFFIRQLVDQGLEPLRIVYYSGLLGSGTLALALVLAAPRYLRAPWRAVPLLVLVGMIGDGLAFWANTNAIGLSGVSVAILLLYTSPAWVALLAWRFLGEPFGARRALAIVAAFAGSALVAQVLSPALLQANLVGVACGLASGLGYAVYSVMSKRLLEAHHPLTVTMYSFGGVALALLPLQAEPLPLALPGQSWPWLTAQVLGSQLVGTVLFYLGLRVLQAGVASLLVMFQLPVAMLLGVLVLGESLTSFQLAGMVLIASSVVALSLGAEAATGEPSSSGAASAVGTG